MKRFMVIAVAASVLGSMVPADAARVAGPQEETGTVLLPAPGPNGEVTGGCWTGYSRRAWILSNGASAGPFGSMFEIDESTWGGTFNLEVLSGASGAEDLDITFYAKPGTIDPVNDPAQQGGIVEAGSFKTRTAGGEKGTVPETATVALVCLGIGTGADAEWEYKAEPPAKKKKGKKGKKK